MSLRFFFIFSTRKGKTEEAEPTPGQWRDKQNEAEVLHRNTEGGRSNRFKTRRTCGSSGAVGTTGTEVVPGCVQWIPETEGGGVVGEGGGRGQSDRGVVFVFIKTVYLSTRWHITHDIVTHYSTFGKWNNHVSSSHFYKWHTGRNPIQVTFKEAYSTLNKVWWSPPEYLLSPPVTGVRTLGILVLDVWRSFVRWTREVNKQYLK